MNGDRILVAIDSSPAACAALRWAVQQADEMDASVSVVHIFDDSGHPDGAGSSHSAEATTDACERVQERTLKVLRTLDADVPVSISTARGRLEPSLVRASSGAAMLVLGKPQSVNHERLPRRLAGKCRCRVVQVDANNQVRVFAGPYLSSAV